MTENDLTILYCKIDDFYHSFIKTNTGKKVISNYNGQRGPKRKLSVPEIMTLNIVRIFDRIGDLKTFYFIVKQEYIKYFPSLPNYENFRKASNKSFPFIAAFVQYQLYINRKRCTEDVFYLDSTPISVCENRYISSNKVSKAFASRGKSTKGWFYGYKLQGVCTKNGTLLKLQFTNGNKHDSQAFNKATKGLKGIIVTDAGYLLKKEELEELYKSGRRPYTATRKNMKRTMTKEQGKLLRNRNCIENVWSVMKRFYNLIYHAARSVIGMFRHFLYSISAFLIHDYCKKNKAELLQDTCLKLDF